MRRVGGVLSADARFHAIVRRVFRLYLRRGCGHLRVMNTDALRSWGIAVTSALIAAALVLSFQPGGRDAEAQQPVQGLYQTAQTPQAAHVGFLVRFRGDGPIARSQALAARGRHAAAQREIEAQLVRQSAFNGLCFDRFTVGAAEVVLRSCEPVASPERAAYQQLWLARLEAMRAVDYVDANASVSGERAPG